MSHVVPNLNGSIPIVKDLWSGYLAQAQELPTTRLLLLAAINLPLLAIVLNVLRQVVRINCF
jgi:sterol 14alpha-demethylase